jgi:hypothetical protein
MEPPERQRPSRLVVALLVAILTVLLVDAVVTVALLLAMRDDFNNWGLLLDAIYGPRGA